MARKLTAALALLLLALLLPRNSARADLFVAIGESVSENVTDEESTTRNVNLSIIQDTDVSGSANSQANMSGGLVGNQVFESGGESVARLTDSVFQEASGIVSVNQSPGNSNNQGNMVSFAYAEADGILALISGGAGELVNTDNFIEALDMTRSNIIEGEAFSHFLGALQVNQSAGCLNNQTNILSVATGNNGHIALSDAALAQQVARNTVRETRVIKQDIITGGAFRNVAGIISVNQSSGCCNNQTNIIVISVQHF